MNQFDDYGIPQEKFRGFQSEYCGILQELNFDQNTGEIFEGFRSEVWKSYEKFGEFRSEYC